MKKIIIFVLAITILAVNISAFDITEHTSTGLYFKVYDPYLLYNSSKTYNETIPEDNILLVSVDTLFGCMNSGNNIIISSEKNYYG